ncbi:hypothetical protein RKD20_000992 [Streptomyces sp. SLBN-8D4]
MADTKARPLAPARARTPGSARTVLLRRARELALVPALLLLMVLGAFVNDSFLTERNLISILGASAALAMVVLAESLVLITGKFDLSLESVVGIAPAPWEPSSSCPPPSPAGAPNSRPCSPCWRSSRSARWSAPSTASWS